MKNKLILILMLLTTTSLSGCYDMKEIDETAYIVALGIDKEEDSNYSYTFQFSSPLAATSDTGGNQGASGNNSSGGKDSSVNNLTVKAPDFYIARNLANNFMSKNIDMSHMKLIVFSSTVDPQTFENHSRLLLREREVRPHTTIAVSAGTASDFLKNVNPELESNTSKYYELMSLRSNNPYAPTNHLSHFTDRLTSGNRDTVLPVGMKGNDVSNLPPDSSAENWISTYHSGIESDRSILCGMAIFKDGKLHGTMDGDSSLIFNILNRNIKTCTITVKDKHNPQQTVSFRIIVPKKADYDINLKTRHITVTQALRAEYLGSILPEGYGSFDELYSYLQSMMTKRISEFLTDISSEKSADILDLREKIRPQFPTWDQWNTFDWNSFYPEASFSVNINLT